MPDEWNTFPPGDIWRVFVGDGTPIQSSRGWKDMGGECSESAATASNRRGGTILINTKNCPQ